MQNNDQKYPNITITGLWETKGGHLRSAALDAKAVEALTAALELGGKIFIRQRSEASIASSKNPEKSPTYYLEFVPKAEVDAYKNKHNSGL